MKIMKIKNKRLLQNRIQINNSKSVLETNQINNLLKDLQLMMTLIRYLKKNQITKSKTELKQVMVKIVIKIKNNKSYLTRNLTSMNLKMGLKEVKQTKGKNKTSSNLLII